MVLTHDLDFSLRPAATDRLQKLKFQGSLGAKDNVCYSLLRFTEFCMELRIGHVLRLVFVKETGSRYPNLEVNKFRILAVSKFESPRFSTYQRKILHRV